MNFHRGKSLITVMFTLLFNFTVSIALLFAILATAKFYKRLPNGKGTLRGWELGPKWQFHEYLKRQPKSAQVLFRWITRFRVACLGAWVGGTLTFCGAGLAFSLYRTEYMTSFMGLFTSGIAWSLWWILNGIGAL